MILNKIGLLIGINYFNSQNELYGCINDTKMIRRKLLKLGYKFENITVLRDDGNGEKGLLKDLKDTLPTRENIIYSLKNIIDISNLTSVDKKVELFISYSGHGSYVMDTNEDEIDKKDEVLVPCDFLTSSFINDDEIRDILKNISSNVNVYMINDCCHSATNVDLPYVYEYIPINKTLRLKENNMEKYKVYDNKNIYSISGCRDSEVSADLYQAYKNDIITNNIHPNDIIKGNISGGALTSTFLSVWINDFIESYRKMFVNGFFGYDKKVKFTQFPCFSSTKLIPTLKYINRKSNITNNRIINNNINRNINRNINDIINRKNNTKQQIIRINKKKKQISIQNNLELNQENLLNINNKNIILDNDIENDIENNNKKNILKKNNTKYLILNKKNEDINLNNIKYIRKNIKKNINLNYSNKLNNFIKNKKFDFILENKIENKISFLKIKNKKRIFINKK